MQYCFYSHLCCPHADGCIYYGYMAKYNKKDILLFFCMDVNSCEFFRLLNTRLTPGDRVKQKTESKRDPASKLSLVSIDNKKDVWPF